MKYTNYMNPYFFITKTNYFILIVTVFWMRGIHNIIFFIVRILVLIF